MHGKGITVEETHRGKVDANGIERNIEPFPVPVLPA